jgi:hypothetical protein
MPRRMMARPCLSRKESERKERGWMVVRSSPMQSQGLHNYARFGKKPRVEGEDGGGGDGEMNF